MYKVHPNLEEVVVWGLLCLVPPISLQSLQGSLIQVTLEAASNNLVAVQDLLITYGAKISLPPRQLAATSYLEGLPPQLLVQPRRHY